MAEELPPILPTAACPVCRASDAIVQQLEHRQAVFVECVNCRVYVATRKAFRHFEYLRWRGESEGLARLDRLASYLKARQPNRVVTLDYDTWHALIEPPAGTPTS